MDKSSGSRYVISNPDQIKVSPEKAAAIRRGPALAIAHPAYYARDSALSTSVNTQPAYSITTCGQS